MTRVSGVLGQKLGYDKAIDFLTFQEPEHESLPQVNHIDDSIPYEGKVFNSDDEAYNFYCLFA